jgi:uncharacterized cupredoxin-like copper-binding protein
MSERGGPDQAPLTRIPFGRRAILTGLVAMLGRSALADSALPRTITVILTEYSFTPDHLTLQHGLPYRVVLRNVGAEIHEFTAPTFLAAIRLQNPEILDASGRQVVVRPGESRSLRFVAPRPGRYPFSCADHDWAGMEGDILVR